MGWTPPSGREPAALDPALIDQDDPEYDSSYEAFYGEHAGGWIFTFGERLLPEEYEGDLEGEDEYDKEEYSQEDIDDADENGNLRDFVVDDDVVEYEDDANQRSILNDTEDDDANSRTCRSHTNQSDSNDDDSDSCSDSDSDDSYNSLVSDNADYIDHDPFPATPRKCPPSPPPERNSSGTFQTVSQTPRKKRIVESLPTPTRTPCTNKKHITSTPCSGDPSPKLQSRGYTRTRVLMSDTESDCASDEDEEPAQSVKANVESAQMFQPKTCMNAVYLPQTPTKRATQKTSATLATPQTDVVSDPEDDTPLPELYERYASGNGSDVWTPKSIKHTKGASQKALQPTLPPTPAPTPARKKRKAQEAIESDSEYVDSISPRRYAQRMESLRTRNSQRRKE
uniref:Uncharacterized protein n=1 Tax=Psilocybe cubensis TaxID=181762 RepID=A0A8H7Y6K7_PSICU